MEPIVVRPHGQRWAVFEDPEAMPVGEYETRELAEVAARGHAGDGGREVRVEAGDVEGEPLRRDGPDARDAALDQRTGGAGAGDDTPRQDQAGL